MTSKTRHDMGGHGGLNILPHKSWNPYGYKQRARVERDEQLECERAEKERRERESRESRDRRTELLSAATGRTAPEVQPMTAASALISTIRSRQQQNERSAVDDDDSEAKERWDLRLRGKVSTRTTDARFDARFDASFQLGGGAASTVPWYARSTSPGLGERVASEVGLHASLPTRVRCEKEEEQRLREEYHASSSRRRHEDGRDEDEARRKERKRRKKQEKKERKKEERRSKREKRSTRDDTITRDCSTHDIKR